MKNESLFKLSLLFVVVLFVQSSIAQDLTQTNLPETAIARLGEGQSPKSPIRQTGPA